MTPPKVGPVRRIARSRAQAAAPDPAPAPSNVEDQTPQGALGEGGIRRLLGYQLAQAAIVTTKLFETEVGSPLGLRPVEFTILQLVNENPLASPTQLARALDISLPGIKQWLDRLASRELMLRQTRHADRRSHRLVLTRAGEQLLAESLRKLLLAERTLREALTEGEQLLLLELLRKVSHLRSGVGS